MELMSWLLLCAFAATVFHQGLGIKTLPQSDIKLNTSLMINPNNKIGRKKILLNINGPPLVHVNVMTELQALFEDPACKACRNCIQRALKAQKNNTHVKVAYPRNQLYYEVLREHFQKAHKPTKRDLINNETKTRKSKGVRVTKYATDNGKVYAVKVDDTNRQRDKSDSKSTCEIYSVKKTFPCDYDERNLLLSVTKPKTKRSKKTKTRVVSVVSTQPPESVIPMHKKRAVRIDENSEVLETFMPSIEDDY